MDLSRLLSDNQLEEKSEVPNQQEKSNIQPPEFRLLSVPTRVPTKRRRRWRPSSKQIREKNQREADNSLILNLTLDVNELKQQVHDCLVRKSIWETRLLVAREQFHARSLQSVDHFFQLFRHGYPSALTGAEDRYLSELLDENIHVGGGITGRSEFYEQWRSYKKLFSVRRISTFTARVVTSDTQGCLVECSGEFEGKVTTATLETVFPRALEDEALTAQVLDRRLVCPTKTLISFDSSGRLINYYAFSDVFEAMSQLLDFDPLRVVRLMSGAAVGEGSILPPVNCIDQEFDASGENQYVSPSHSSGSARTSIDFILS
ncbi:hypothetical protein P3T76_005665 [Phytophthora citrophthora]|uniref:Bzip transcription factor n=1 Tax=Phytophthora citrophthora TaxID=4793 RepID=A0AAD9LMT1_9STRA|nr:hypothetical protein P3T76_005665 [Phytophthora citrophthora]